MLCKLTLAVGAVALFGAVESKVSAAPLENFGNDHHQVDDKGPGKFFDGKGDEGNPFKDFKGDDDKRGDDKDKDKKHDEKSDKDDHNRKGDDKDHGDLLKRDKDHRGECDEHGNLRGCDEKKQPPCTAVPLPAAAVQGMIGLGALGCVALVLARRRVLARFM